MEGGPIQSLAKKFASRVLAMKFSAAFEHAKVQITALLTLEVSGSSCVGPVTVRGRRHDLAMPS